MYRLLIFGKMNTRYTFQYLTFNFFNYPNNQRMGLLSSNKVVLYTHVLIQQRHQLSLVGII